MTKYPVKLPTLHEGQIRAHYAQRPSARQLDLDRRFIQNTGGRFRAVRCGRRWGKTDFGKTWVGDGTLRGYPCGIFAPDYKRMIEMYKELEIMLKPVIPSRGGANKTEGVIRLVNGGRIDFWTLEDPNAGRSRKYKRVFLDECAFTKPNMLEVWEKAIQPTLLDLRGECVAASNTNGIAEDNFLWQICNQPQHGFIEVHEPSWNNPHVPGPIPGLSPEENELERQKYYDKLKAKTPPLVHAQEYGADFVDWSGVAFFGQDKWLNEEGRPYPFPDNCDRVFAVIDSAVKTGSDNDGTAVTYFARNQWGIGPKLLILDWEIVQVEGAVLDDWLMGVFRRLEELSRVCGAREGVRGVWIEDKSSGMVLLQQARKRNLAVESIGGTWLTLGKDERAMSVSSYHYQGLCKISEHAFNKTTIYKEASRNHLSSQVNGFRIGDKDNKRADDLLDTYVHGLALTFGDQDQF